MNFTERLEQSNENYKAQRKAYQDEIKLLAKEYIETVITPFCERYNLQYSCGDESVNFSLKYFWFEYEEKLYSFIPNSWWMELYGELHGLSDELLRQHREIKDVLNIRCIDPFGRDSKSFSFYCSELTQ